MTVLKADQQAAERVLKAAVRRAVEELRDYVAMTRDVPGPIFANRRVNVVYRTPGDAYDRAVRTLATATTAAALLLDEPPAKKAAARKGAS